MEKRRRFIIGGAIILAALSYLIYSGMRQAVVYFVTPSELKAEAKGAQGKSLRVGGMVVQGSLQKDLQKLSYAFHLSDGKASIPVYFQGIPPDLFAEGKGAVVEGRLAVNGVFMATTIMAKHAEEYSPPHEGKPSSPKSFIPGQEARRP